MLLVCVVNIVYYLLTITSTSLAVKTMSESVALNYKRIKRKNAIIAIIGVLGVDYPLNSEHKERTTKERV